MKFDKTVLIINGVITGISLLLILQSGLSGAGFGFAAILIAAVNLILLVIYSFAGNRNAMFTALIFAAVLLTIGFSVCSNSRMDFR